jgi:phospho-N-acetylmuramoyl-pentapeptide-transferase
MFYHLFKYLDSFDFPGAGMFEYLTFRAAMAIITSLIISMLFGKRIIQFLQKKQIGEVVRNLGLEGQYQKHGTPSMGGIIILASILIPILLFGNLTNIYVILMLVSTIWLGLIGFLDDYIKIFKKNKAGLAGKFKIFGQIVLGLVVGVTLMLSEDVFIREYITDEPITATTRLDEYGPSQVEDTKSTKTTIPFVKNHEFDYTYLVAFLGEKSQQWGWVVFILAVIFIVTAVSNGVNLTDGLDGLAAGTTAICGTTLGVFAWLSGNAIYAKYLNIMYIPYTGELVIYAGALLGATIGFLWYNAYPAQVFMGDTGSLALGGSLAVFAILIRKELLIPILCGIFLVESLSVLIQVTYFKRTRKKYGAGKRVFLMAPLHHHYQKKGYTEPKIVLRFWIVGLMLAVITIVTLKIR